MISDKIIRSVFNQCKDALSVPFNVTLFTKPNPFMDVNTYKEDYGGCEATAMHGEYNIYINPVFHSEDDINCLKNSCIHELIHTYMIPSMAMARLGTTKKENKMYMYVHERDVATMATCLCRTIKVKEEEIKFKSLDKVEKV